MTKKAYYDEPFIKEFTARVTSNIREGELSRVGLERTYFYPDSGGQPHDTGKMDGHDVVNVIVDGGEIYHLVDGDIGDGEVACRIDWDRRMDHMQQHTGQHILSQAIFKVIGKGSESLHIGRETSSIDIESGDIAPSQIDEIERVANGAVMEDLPIETYIVDSTKGLDLRKETCLDGDIRIVDIKGYDMTPCGGTHLDRTGKVGPIKILKWYRKGRYQRIEFVCGWRCIKTMQTNGTALQSLGNMLMVPVGEVYGKVEGIEEERRELIRRTKALEESLMEETARRLLDEAPTHRGMKVMHGVMENLPLVQHICKLATEDEGTVCLLASPAKKGAILTFGSSKGSGVDVSKILRETLDKLGGKGGGGQNYASGSCSDTADLSAVLEEAANGIKGN